MPEPHVAAAKAVLRQRMRELRRSLPDRPQRSERILAHLTTLEPVVSARRVMAFETIPGEPEMDGLRRWSARRSIEYALPEDDVVPSWPDVVIVPGVAFTRDGRRLGQGGGWYDRFLPQLGDEAVAIGVGFAPQIVDDLPIEVHDVALDCVVTEEGPRWRGVTYR